MGISENLQKFRVQILSVTELTEVPGIVARSYRTHLNEHRAPRVLLAEVYPYPEYCATVLQK